MTQEIELTEWQWNCLMSRERMTKREEIASRICAAMATNPDRGELPVKRAVQWADELLRELERTEKK